MNKTLIYSLFIAFAILSLGAVILPSNVNMASAQVDDVIGDILDGVEDLPILGPILGDLPL